MTESAVLGVQLLDEGLQIAYMKEGDAKANGLVFQRSVFVPSGSDYDDELEAVAETLRALLADVLEDEEAVEALPQRPEADEPDESLFTFGEEV
jgi:hypothetical protein